MQMPWLLPAMVTPYFQFQLPPRKRQRLLRSCEVGAGRGLALPQVGYVGPNNSFKPKTNRCAIVFGLIQALEVIMKVHLAFLTALLASTLGLSSFARAATASSWVHGEWSSCQNPHEILTFFPQESAQLTRNGITTPLVYKISGGTVKVGVLRIGDVEPFWAEPGNNRQTLRVVEPAGSTRTYVRPGPKSRRFCGRR